MRSGDREAVPALISVLDDSRGNTSVDVVEALGKLGDPSAVQTLIDRIDRYKNRSSNNSSRVVELTAEALGRLGEVRAIPHLLAHLPRAEDDLVIDAVAMALRQLGDTLAMGMMIDVLQSDESYAGERARAVRALGVLENTAAVLPLIRALEDEEAVVRRSAALALGYLRDLRAFEPIVNLLDDEDAYVRASGASALGGLGDARAMPHLSAALDDDDWRVRRASERSLERLWDS